MKGVEFCCFSSLIHKSSIEMQVHKNKISVLWLEHVFIDTHLTRGFQR